MLYLSLALLAILAGLLVYRYDMYEKEPLWMLLIAFAAGFGSMYIVGWIEDLSLNQFTAYPRKPAEIALVASTHEEISRLVVVGLIAMIFRKQFNDPMDGLIYGSIAGLGMAVSESLFYLGLNQVPRDRLLPAAEVVRLSGHLIMGGITCFGLGMMRIGLRHWPLVLIAGVLFSMLLHFLWDFIAFTVHMSGEMALHHTLAAMAIMFCGMFVYGVLVVIGSDWSRQIFAPAAPRRVWGWPFDVIVNLQRAVRWSRHTDAES